MSDEFCVISGNNAIDLPLRRMLTLSVSIPTFIVGDSFTSGNSIHHILPLRREEAKQRQGFLCASLSADRQVCALAPLRQEINESSFPLHRCSYLRQSCAPCQERWTGIEWK